MKYQDIQIPDLDLRGLFVDYWLNGQYTEAFAILANNPQLDNKAFVADCFNLVAQAIIALEAKYSTEVTGYLSTQLTQYNIAIGQFRQMSNWSSTTRYVVGNFVTYNDEIYLCYQDNINQVPTNENYWAYIRLRGLQGAGGIDVNLKYQWSGAINYAIRDVVYYDDCLWVATQANINQKPSVGSDYWGIFLKLPRAKIIVSQTPPAEADRYDGLIWCQVLE